MRRTLEALKHLEQAVAGARWTNTVVLRYGAVSGRGPRMGHGASEPTRSSRRRFPTLGDGAGVWSFVSRRRRARAPVAAAKHGERGSYQVVDTAPVA